LLAEPELVHFRLAPVHVVECRTVPAQVNDEKVLREAEVDLKSDLIAAVAAKFLPLVEDRSGFVWNLLALLRRLPSGGRAEVNRGLCQRVTFAIQFLQQRELGPGLKAVLVTVDVLVSEAGAEAVEGLS
jgi:hypothetical protein